MIATTEQLQQYKELNNAWYKVLSARSHCAIILTKADMNHDANFHRNVLLHDAFEMSTDLYRFVEDNTYTTRWGGIECNPENLTIQTDRLLAYTMVKLKANNKENLLYKKWKSPIEYDYPWKLVPENALEWAEDQFEKRQENERTRIPPG